MTVLEYIKIVNGISDNEMIDPNKIKYFGYLDVDAKNPYSMTDAFVSQKILIESGKLIVINEYETAKGKLYCPRRMTLLNDDISLHCKYRVLDALERTKWEFKKRINMLLVLSDNNNLLSTAKRMYEINKCSAIINRLNQAIKGEKIKNMDRYTGSKKRILSK